MRETECFSMNSLISSRMRDSGEANRSAASCLTSSVLPTPVEPTKMKDTGLCLAAMPTRPRRMALDTAFTAPSWPTMWDLRRWSSLASRSNSCSWMEEAGILVHSSMTRARWAAVSGGSPLAARMSRSPVSWA